jgi:hypothetical protein
MEKQIEKFLSIMSPVFNPVFRAISKEGIVSTISKDWALKDKEDNIYFL